MNRTAIQPELDLIPQVFRGLFRDAAVFDSSCSSIAKVYYIEKEGGLYLKAAEAGSLRQETEMDAYFHSLGLGPEVVEYHTEDRDWLLTRAIRGEDCTHGDYLAEPKRLAEAMAQILFDLHRRDFTNCPVQDHTARYLRRAAENYAAGRYDASLFPDNWGHASAEAAWAVVEANGKYLKTDTLLHGDYCLPNIMLDNWQFSGFIDVGGGGVGDRHVDLFWGKWTLNYNLKTDKYCDYFLDAYGRENFDEEMLRVIAAIEVFL